jgi:hypothetical protein
MSPDQGSRVRTGRSRLTSALIFNLSQKGCGIENDDENESDND